MRETPYYPFGGGLDVVSPVQQMQPGALIASNNFEPWINGGYRRMLGFERYDGRPKPSDATWIWVTVGDASSYSVGDVITGDTSGATGTIVAIGTGDYVNDFAITKVTGTFTDTEDIDTATTTISALSTGSAPTVALQETWRLAAQDDYRDDVAVVPGEGDVLGVWQCRDRVYAIRNNVGSTAAVVHKATSSGWDDTPLTMCYYMAFDSGSQEFVDGETIEGQTSSATGVVHRHVLLTGSYGGGDATGYVIMSSVTGTWQDNETIDGSTSGVNDADTASVATQFSLPAGGQRYDWETQNFLGGSTTYRCYGCNGEGPAFEIDENDIVSPILMDLTLGDAPSENKPYLVAAFDGALWLMFEGGSLQKSVVGAPLQFNGFLGAAEFGLSDEGTALVDSAGRVLIAFTRSQTFGFFPVSAGGYERRTVSERSGAILHSEGEVASIYAVDDSGLIDLQRIEAFGDFANSTVSDPVQPLMVANRNRIVGTLMVRETNQYRVLYSNGNGMIGRVRPDGAFEFGPFTYNTGVNETIFTSASCEDGSSIPTYYFAGSTGYVYEAEKGQSHDGAEIESFIKLPYTHMGAPAVRKRFRLALVDVEAVLRVILQMGQDNDFGNQEAGTSNWSETIDTAWGGGGLFDVATWDESYYDSDLYDFARFEMRGSGRNTSLVVYHKSAVTEPFVLQGVIYHFDSRRQSR